VLMLRVVWRHALHAPTRRLSRQAGAHKISYPLGYESAALRALKLVLLEPAYAGTARLPRRLSSRSAPGNRFRCRSPSRQTRS
jgi:hypothetical protein